MPWSCYSYLAGTPDRDAGQAARRDLRRMPFSCYSYPMMRFSYPDDRPHGGNSELAEPPRPSLREMPMTCFRY